MSSQPFNLDRTVRLCISLAVVTFLLYMTQRLSGVLVPFVISWFLAYLINPIVNFFQYKVKIKNRVAAVIITIVLLFVVVGLLILGLATPISREALRMASLVGNYVNSLETSGFLSEAWQASLKQWLNDLDWATMFTSGTISAAWDKVSPYLGGMIGGSMSFLSSLLVGAIIVLYLIFILIDFDDMAEGLINVVPPKYRKQVSEVFSDLKNGMSKYFRSQALIAMTVGVLFAIGFAIMRLPLAIVVGLLIGLFNMVPYLQGVGIPICMVLGLLQSFETGTAYWIILLEILAVFAVVQTIQETVLNPLIMGNTLGMKPALMLLSLSIFGSLFGVVGMIIALPLTTVIISYYKRYILKEETVEVKETQQS